jgi:GTP cyclohydrolase N terminal
MASNESVLGILQELRSHIGTLAEDNAVLRKEMHDMKAAVTASAPTSGTPTPHHVNQAGLTSEPAQKSASEPAVPTLSRHDVPAEKSAAHLVAVDARPRSGSGNWAPTKKIVLQTYPKQAGVHPVQMDWGNSDPQSRGPVVVSHSASTVKRRNGGILTFVR